MTTYDERQREHVLTGKPLPRRDRVRDNLAATAGYLIIPAIVLAYALIDLLG